MTMSLDASTRIGTFDTSRFDLRGVFREILGVRDIGRLHLEKPSRVELLDVDTDQGTTYHQILYKRFEGFRCLYIELVREVVKREFGQSRIVYQRVPTFRVHLPGNLAVGEFHRDSDYGHSSGEVNVWVPLVDAVGTRSIYLDIGGPEPQEVRYGEYLVFDAIRIRHGNVANETDQTRVSFDFRVCDPTEFVERPVRSATAGLTFDLNEYFAVLDVDQHDS
jgi:hypothetical protein